MLDGLFKCGAVLLIGLQLAGCYRDYGAVPAEPDPVLRPGYAAPVLQPGEKLKVTVYGEEALTGPYDINPSGDISIPLIGTVRAAGHTRSELERELTARFVRGKYLQEPKVTVDVMEFRPIYVVGETLRPGAYPYKAGLNVLTAITLAGGPTYRASRDTVFLQHPGEVVWNEYPLSASILVGPGDLIRVPERYF